MADEVYANGRDVACKAGDGKSICAFPDVCLTPPTPPAGPLPIPYPNTGLDSDTSEGSKTVVIAGKELMLKDKSSFKKSTGDEAATKSQGMGVVTHQIQGKVYFNSWSMDVKIEGENAVRHLDMTTHNHGSGATNSPPWPFTKKSSVNNKKHPCNKYAKGVEENCTDPPEDCNTTRCCAARKCMLVPAALSPDSANKCKGCNRGGKPMTPHHIIPVKDHFTEAAIGAKRTGPDLKDNLSHGNKSYDPDKAPGICVAGSDHSKPEANGRLKQHGRIGRAYVYMRNKLKGDTYEYEDVSAKAAKQVAHHVDCDEKCIKKQMDEYHEAHSKGKLRKCKLAEIRGEGYHREAIPDDSVYGG